MLRRWIAACLLCLFIPCGALGEAFNFNCSFTCAPYEEDSTIAGFLDLLKQTMIQGTFLASENDGGFDLQCSLKLDSNGLPETSIHLYGVEGMMKLESPLWEYEPVLLNIPAALEYGMKLDAHLGIPLQQTLIFYPWISLDAWRSTWENISAVFHTRKTSHQVPLKHVLSLSEKLTDLVYQDRALRYWFETVAGANMAGETLQNAYFALPAWIRSVSLGNAWDVNINNDTETWSVSGNTIVKLINLSDPQNRQIHVYLPGFLNGEDMHFDFETKRNGDTYDSFLSCEFGPADSPMLIGTWNARNLPCTWPAVSAWNVDVDFHGSLLEGISFPTLSPEKTLTLSMVKDSLGFQIQGDHQSVNLLLNSIPVLTAHISTDVIMTPELPVHTFYETDGVNFFSFNDESLRVFVQNHRSSIIRGLLPILEALPVSTLQGILNALTNSGIFSLMLYPVDESEYGEYETNYEESDSYIVDTDNTELADENYDIYEDPFE